MFEHLKRLDIIGAQSWLDMPELGKGARLLLNPANEANKFYHNAFLKKAGRRARRLAASGEISAEDVRQSRAEDRELYPLYVIAGWECLRDEVGNEVLWSKDAARELCEQLPDWLFDRVSAHARIPERFLPDEEPAPDAGELAKNSESASASS